MDAVDKGEGNFLGEGNLRIKTHASKLILSCSKGLSCYIV
jgi:hypothetical protein